MQRRTSRIAGDTAVGGELINVEQILLRGQHLDKHDKTLTALRQRPGTDGHRPEDHSGGSNSKSIAGVAIRMHSP